MSNHLGAHYILHVTQPQALPSEKSGKEKLMFGTVLALGEGGVGDRVCLDLIQLLQV